MFRTPHTLTRLGTRPIAPLSQCTRLRRGAASASPKPRVLSIHSYWTEGDKLSLSERYPLSAGLDAVLNPRVVDREEAQGRGATDARHTKVASGAKARPKSGVHLRNQIVSPDLCDDILKYIAPTLEQHKGCDILDINPGACLWSQKLHEYLKPRSHILFEPNYNLFKQWIDPLISAPGSKYKLIPGDTLKLESWRSVVNNENFPHQTYKKPEDADGQELNPTLLVTGSLSWDPLLPGFGFDSMAKQLYNHLSVAPWSNDIVNVFGPVRSLFWVGSEDFSRQVARSMSHMRRASFLLQLTQRMEVIALSERDSDTSKNFYLARAPQYDIQSTFEALKRGEEAGMVVPEHRRNLSHHVARILEEATNGAGELSYFEMLELLVAEHRKGKDMTAYLGQSLATILNNEKEFARANPEYYIAPVFPLESKTTEGPVANAPDPELNKKHRAARSAIRKLTRTRIDLEEAGKLNMKMIQLERKLAKLPAGSAEKNPLLQAIQDLDDRCHVIINSLSKNLYSAPGNEFDDVVSVRHSSTPPLQWDSRPYDSLAIEPDEVWPRSGMMLISTTPTPRPTCPDSPDFHEWLLDFATGIYQDARKSVPEALDTMQHSLSDIIKDCPSLTDGEKGGRYNLKYFRVRMLTREMLEELTRAYMGWPFKTEGSDHSWYFRGKGRQIKRRVTAGRG